MSTFIAFIFVIVMIGMLFALIKHKDRENANNIRQAYMDGSKDAVEAERLRFEDMTEVYWQLLMTVEGNTSLTNVLDKTEVESAYRVWNRTMRCNQTQLYPRWKDGGSRHEA